VRTALSPRRIEQCSLASHLHGPSGVSALSPAPRSDDFEQSIDGPRYTAHTLFAGSWGNLSPLLRCSCRRPLPHSHRSASAKGMPPFDMFRPRGFAPPRRLTPLAGSGCIAPRYRTGFAGFPPRLRSGPSRRLSATPLTSSPHPWLSTGASTPRRPLPAHSRSLRLRLGVPSCGFHFFAPHTRREFDDVGALRGSAPLQGLDPCSGPASPRPS